MFYQNDYNGSPWLQDETSFAVGGYDKNYGRRYIDGYGEFHEMRNSDFIRNQRSYGVYRNEMENNLRRINYGGPSRQYMNNIASRVCLPRSSLSRKRLHIRSPTSDLNSKRPNIESNRISTKTRRLRASRRKVQNKPYKEDGDGGVKLTEKLPDGECESFERWKPSDENKEAEGSMQNDRQITHFSESCRKQGKSVFSKKHFCYVCKVKCINKETLDKHKNSKIHTDKFEELLTISREKKADDATENTETGDRKISSRYSCGWCTVCNCAFTGYFRIHSKTKEHKVNFGKKYVKCRICRVFFKNVANYKNHCKRQDHKLKSAKFHYFRNLASAVFDDCDEEALKPAEVEKKECKKVNMEENKENMDSVDDDTSIEDKSTGQSFVVPVSGYYCILCHKFFKNVTVAKYKHCCSIMHSQAFEKAMEEALAQEEERQRADDIAEIESAAKESIRRKPAGKEANTETVDNNVEMDEEKTDSKSSEQETADEYKPGIKNGIQEKVKTDYEEIDKSKDVAIKKKTEESEAKEVQSK